jgi:hypothetical protein
MDTAYLLGKASSSNVLPTDFLAVASQTRTSPSTKLATSSLVNTG